MTPTTTLAERALLLPALCSPRPHSIELHLDAPCHRGSNITSYDILCSRDPEFEQHVQQFQLAGDATSMNVDGLEPNTVYYFKYRAQNEVGSSPWTARTPGVVTTAKPPMQPLAPTRVEQPGRQPPFELHITWVAPHSYDLPIKSYFVRVSTSPNMEKPLDVPICLPHPKPPAHKASAHRGASKASANAPADAGAQLCQGVPVHPSVPVPGRPLGLNMTPPIVTEMKVKGLEPCTSYYFQVRATNQIGESAWSPASHPMETGAAPPSRCGRPLFVACRRGVGIAISWQPPETYGVPGGIQRYDVRVAETAGMHQAVEIRDVETQVDVVDKETIISSTVRSTWNPDVTHYYQVRGISSAGEGEWSESSEAMKVAPEEPLRPDPPYEFTVLPRAMVVRWRTSDCRGSPITGYRLRYSTSRDMVSPTEVPGMASRGLATECAVTALKPHHTYYFQVSCVNAVGQSDWSTVSRPVAAQQAPPSKMGAPVLMSATATSISVGFVAPADLGTRDGDMLQSYTVRYADGAEGMAALESDAAGTSKHPGIRYLRAAKADGVEVTNLLPGRPCAFQVFAHNEFGDGPPSDTAVFRTVCAAPDAPHPPERADQTSWSITLCLLPTSDNGSPITRYKLEGEDVGNKEVWQTEPFENCAFAEEKQHFCVTRLKPGRCYRFRAMAYNAKGESDWSEYSEDLSTQPVQPEAVTDLSFSDVEKTTFLLTWSPSFDNGDPITEYMIQWSSDGTFHKSVQEMKATTTQAVLTDCLPGAKCYARVAAANSEGFGRYGPAIDVLMLGDVPQRPAAPKPVERGPTHVKVGWSYPHDSGSKIINCVLRYWETETDGRPEHERDSGEVDVGGRKRSYLLEPMYAGREYVYEVAMINEMGMGPFSPLSVPARIAPAEVPSPAGQPSFVRCAPNSMAMSWTSSHPMGSDIIEQVAQLCVDPNFPEEKVIECVLPPCPQPERVPPSQKCGRRSISSVSDDMSKRMFSEMLQATFELEGLREGTRYYVRVAARNGVGLGLYGPASEPHATLCRVPDPIPHDPGIEPLETGCTTLTVGWKRPYCQGGPISHYNVRCAPSQEGLHLEDCFTFDLEEEEPAVWEGMAAKPREQSKVEKANLEDREHIITFVKYVLARFGTIQESWEWLDANGNGTVCKDEFLEGDVDTGPPFADFENSELLPQVWTLLDNDGSCEISVNEYNKLWPYMEAIKAGSAGQSYDGVRCMVPNLMPGRLYYVMARAVNEMGPSEWTVCRAGPQRTSSMTPGIGAPVGGAQELRRKDAVTLRWILPEDNGEALTRLEMRYRSCDVEDGPIDRDKLRDQSTHVAFQADASTGGLATEYLVEGLLPGQVVFASIRAFNAKGGSRLWSALPGYSTNDNRAGYSASGLPDDLVTWECCSLPTVPDKPDSAAFIPDTLWSKDFKSAGEFSFKSTRANGLPFTGVTYRVLDASSNVIQEHFTESKGPDAGEIQWASLRRACSDLLPGEVYSLQVRLHNKEGASEWSEIGQQCLMPADLPMTPKALLCEGRSLEWIELKWFPPHHNGAPIDAYDIMINDVGEHAPEESWWHVDAETLQKGTREFGADGRRVPERDAGTLLFTVENLQPACIYYFKVRARNAIGWSAWSCVTYIKTKAVRPGKTPLPEEGLTKIVDASSLEMNWGVPDCHGTPLLRFDIIVAPCKRRINWLVFATRILNQTVDLEALFSLGKDEAEGAAVIEDGVTGFESMADLMSEDLRCESVPPEQTGHSVAGLLRGQSYYWMVRGINAAGKGEFSEIVGPLTVEPGTLSDIALPDIGAIKNNSCEVALKLPYDMGSQISRVDLVLTRLHGPLAAEDTDPDTGDCHASVARRALSVVPHNLEKRLPAKSLTGGNSRWRPTATDALIRSFQFQEVDCATLWLSGHEPTFLDCTGVSYVVPFGDLLPGNRYELRWSCRSGMGQSHESVCAFQTLAAEPDMPGMLLIPGL
eukprot:TRINITY_DN20815_c0_g2_i1.p1 TRINITY_DN20815_c0_g2~~TRINITY_DN20815_c0_g2_i1.p1  ORF type:complete len:2074 (+),score=246.85 TRINITY_DN20815_c0_g2_i1:353-6223(+)